MTHEKKAECLNVCQGRRGRRRAVCIVVCCNLFLRVVWSRLVNKEDSAD